MHNSSRWTNHIRLLLSLPTQRRRLLPISWLEFFCLFMSPAVTLRPFNTFGLRQSTRAVLPTLMTQALYRDRIAAGSLAPVRDMNYVADTVAAFLGVGAAEGVEGGVFNVGSGRGRTIGDMLSAVQRVVGVDKPSNWTKRG